MFLIPQTDLSVGVLTVLVEGKDWSARLPVSVFDANYIVWLLLLRLQASCRRAASQLASQPTSQPASHPPSQPVTQPASQPVTQPTSHPNNQPAKQPVIQSSPQAEVTAYDNIIVRMRKSTSDRIYGGSRCGSGSYKNSRSDHSDCPTVCPPVWWFLDYIYTGCQSIAHTLMDRCP